MNTEQIDEIMLGDHESRIRAMMVGYGQDTPTGPIMPSFAVRRLRVRLLLEEVLEFAEDSGVGVVVYANSGFQQLGKIIPGEDRVTVSPGDILLNACGAPNLVKMVDALSDISVVNTGAFVSFGVRSAPLLECVDRNNLLKIANGRKDEGGKFIKHPDHVPPDFRAELVKQGWEPDKDATVPTS